MPKFFSKISRFCQISIFCSNLNFLFKFEFFVQISIFCSNFNFSSKFHFFLLKFHFFLPKFQSSAKISNFFQSFKFFLKFHFFAKISFFFAKISFFCQNFNYFSKISIFCPNQQIEFLARQIVLEIDGDCDFTHVYPALVNAIKSVEGKYIGGARFPLNRDIMLPVSRSYLIIGY